MTRWDRRQVAMYRSHREAIGRVFAERERVFFREVDRLLDCIGVFRFVCMVLCSGFSNAVSKDVIVVMITHYRVSQQQRRCSHHM